MYTWKKKRHKIHISNENKTVAIWQVHLDGPSICFALEPRSEYLT